MNKKVICPRCGREIAVTNMGRHESVCERLPLPQELAAILANEQCTAYDLAERYEVSDTAVLAHLRHAGVDNVSKGRGARYKTCPRCGLKTSAPRYEEHRRLCVRLPLPAELLQAVEDGETIADLCRRYGSTHHTMAARVNQARQQAKFGGNHCRECGILLGHPAVAPSDDDEGLCAECAANPWDPAALFVLAEAMA